MVPGGAARVKQRCFWRRAPQDVGPRWQGDKARRVFTAPNMGVVTAIRAYHSGAAGVHDEEVEAVLTPAGRSEALVWSSPLVRSAFRWYNGSAGFPRKSGIGGRGRR
jgi:hypothetical protein